MQPATDHRARYLNGCAFSSPMQASTCRRTQMRQRLWGHTWSSSWICQSSMVGMPGVSMMKSLDEGVPCRPRCHGMWQIGIWRWMPSMLMFHLAVRQHRRPFMQSSDPRARVTVSTTTATTGVTTNHVSMPMPVQTVAGRAMRAARVALTNNVSMPMPVQTVAGRAMRAARVALTNNVSMPMPVQTVAGKTMMPRRSFFGLLSHSLVYG